MIAVAAVALVAGVLLGLTVARRPPARFDRAVMRLRGHGTAIAAFFTRSGYWQALTCICIAVGAIEIMAGERPVFAIILAATQLLSQFAGERFKDIVRRVRPDDWILRHERGFSYPSGHATTAVLFYGGLIYYVARLPLPHEVRLGLSVLLAVWVAGIPLSRPVLAAHYGTDVIGGLLFGVVWLCALIFLLQHVPALGIFA